MPYQVRTLDRKLVQTLKQKYALDDFFAKLLAAKQFTTENVYYLLHLEKVLMQFTPLVNLEKAIKSALKYIEDPQAVIYIFADYDVDGMTSGYILYDALMHVACCKVYLYYPERHEGYGLSMPWCRWTARKSRNYSQALVLTTDNGTNCLEEINYLQEQGLEVIVTDHHQLLGEMPNCIVVNPQCYPEDNHKHLAGCGVAYYFIKMLQMHYNIQDDIKYLDFVALGTIADMMPMTLENIAFCFYGLDMINTDLCHPLITVLKRYFKRKTYNYRTLAFEINSCLNGCSRMGHMAIVKQAILHPEDITNIESVIYYYNKRKTITKALYKEITTAQKQFHIFVIDAYIGLAGLIANQLLKELQKDILVFVDKGTYYKGSARGYKNHNLLGCLKALQSQFKTLQFGGHNAALGIQIDKKEFKAFSQAFEAEIAKEITINSLTWIDFELPYEQIDNDLYETVHALPYDEYVLTEPIFKTTALFISFNPTSNPHNGFLTIKSPKHNTYHKIWVENLNAKFKNFVKNTPIILIGTLTKNFTSSKDETMLRIMDVLCDEDDKQIFIDKTPPLVLKPPKLKMPFILQDNKAICL